MSAGPGRVRVGVVGVGYLGYFHAQKYAALDEAELVAVVDVAPERAEKAAQDFGTRPLTDHRRLLGQVDAVSIVAPTQEHFSLAEEFLEAGVHLLVEKPMTTDLAQADRLIDLAEAKGLILQVGHLERFNPAVMALKDVLTRPLLVETQRLTPFQNRSTDVDVVLDLMIHDIDILLSLTGSLPLQVRALGARIITDSPDVANARLEFASGLAANLTASRISGRPCRQITVFQPDSHVSVDCASRTLTVFSRSDGPGEEILPGIRARRQSFEVADPLADELAAFIKAVRQGRPPLVGGREARQALEVALHIADQIERGPLGGRR